MQNEHWTWSCDKSIPSEHGASRPVIEEVLAQLAAHDWIEHDCFGIHLALEEALVNAIEHGNQFDGSKQVEFTCRISSEKIWIQITDQGPGFDCCHVPDPTAPENLDRPCGRGRPSCGCSHVPSNAAPEWGTVAPHRPAITARAVNDIQAHRSHERRRWSRARGLRHLGPRAGQCPATRAGTSPVAEGRSISGGGLPIARLTPVASAPVAVSEMLSTSRQPAPE